MLRSRIIPCLLIHNSGLVKTINFKDHKYVGDPLNAVKIFNEKNADELVVLDIDASVSHREPNYELIKKLANECRMPLCYGGGVKSVDHFEKIIELGVEKIAISSSAIQNPALIKDASSIVGNQSVVVILDLKKRSFRDKYDVYIHNAKEKINKDALSLIKEFESLGAGEIVINSIDNDGKMQGYNIDLIKKIKNQIHTPLTVLGGAGSLEDFSDIIKSIGTIGCAAGSLFVFKGKYRAVLINYPSPEEKDKITL